MVRFVSRLLVVLCLILGCASAHATNYFVSPIGSNSNPGTSRTAPFLTCDYAATKAVNPGDTVTLVAGTHTSFTAPYFCDIRSKGTAANPIIFQGEEGTIVDGAYSADGLFILWESAEYITIKNMEMKRGIHYGIYGYGSYTNGGSHNITIKNNRIHDIGNNTTILCTNPDYAYGRSAIYTKQYTTYYTLDGNTIYTIGRLPGGCPNDDYKHDHGFYAQGREHVSQNNIYYGMHAGWGIKADGYCGTLVGTYSITSRNDTFAFDSNPATYAHLTIYNNATTSCGDGTTLKYPKTLIENDIFYQPPYSSTHNAAIRVWNTYHTPVVMRNNITTAPLIYDIYSTPSTGGSYTSTNNKVNYNYPYFLSDSETTPNFALVAGFYGIDRGYANGLTWDINGDIRPVGAGIDMGAYEVQTEDGGGDIPPIYSPARLRLGSGVAIPLGSGVLLNILQ